MKKAISILLAALIVVSFAGCQNNTSLNGTENLPETLECSVCGAINSIAHDFCSACGCGLKASNGNPKDDINFTNTDSNTTTTQTQNSESEDTIYTDTYNSHGDFQSSLFNMAIEGDWIFYGNYYDSSDGIKRTLVNGGEYSKYNIETVFNPSQHKKEMAEKLGWNTASFYEDEDVTSINNLQVVKNWVYWASDCAIWRFPNRYDADIFDLELIAVIGLPERPSCTNFYVDGEWVYFACNAIAERYDSSTALVEHTLCKLNLETKERIALVSAPSTNERLGDLHGNEYYKLMDFKTICPDGRIYFSDYTKEYIYFYKDGKVTETNLQAFVVNSSSYTDSHDETLLYSSKNGHIVAVYGNWSKREYYYCTDENLSNQLSIESFSCIADDGYYYTSYVKLSDDWFNYDGLYKAPFEGSSKKITNDDLPGITQVHTAGVCGEYFYYYTEGKSLCRMHADGGNWEDVTWMIQ